MVSFGEEKGAQLWLAENFTSPPQLDMIVDSDRLLYSLIGAKCSFKSVWCTDCLTNYSEQVACGRDLPKAYEDIEDDPHQMGGNFTVEFDPQTSRFKMGFVYKSKTPYDRPTCEQLLNCH